MQNEQIIEAVAMADTYLTNVGLPSYTELRNAAKLGLCAIDVRISSSDVVTLEEERAAYEMLCAVLSNEYDVEGE